jgi:hypothetical protein
MKQSETITKLLEAFTLAQAEFTTLPKDKNGYGYKYTDLDTVISSVRPILAKHGLGFMQMLTTLENGKSAITTRLFSKEGEYLEDTTILPEVAMAKTNSAQNLGAAITYMKRYALCAMLGISSDEDTDAVSPQQIRPQQSQQNFRAQPKTQTNPVQLAGGADTGAEHEQIEKLMAARTESGQLIFTKDEAVNFGKMRATVTAQDLIKMMNEEIKKRKEQMTSSLKPEDIF